MLSKKNMRDQTLKTQNAQLEIKHHKSVDKGFSTCYYRKALRSDLVFEI
jgi:hypothetical protein